MVDELPKPRVITSRLAAGIVVILTGYAAVLTLRSAFWQAPHRFQWLLPLERMLPSWAVLTVNVAIYAWILYLCIAFPRILEGKERVLVAGWGAGLVLSPIQGLVSASVAAAIQHMKAVSIMVALVAAIVILVEGPNRDGIASSESISR